MQHYLLKASKINIKEIYCKSFKCTCRSVYSASHCQMFRLYARVSNFLLLFQLCETLEAQKWQLRAKAVPVPWLGLSTFFPAAWLPISPVCQSSCLEHVPKVSCHAEEAKGRCCCTTEPHPTCGQDVASSINPDQELKQAPGFPKLISSLN